MGRCGEEVGYNMGRWGGGWGNQQMRMQLVQSVGNGEQEVWRDCWREDWSKRYRQMGVWICCDRQLLGQLSQDLVISMKLLLKTALRLPLTHSLLLRSTHSFAQTSRDIENKMREQRAKNLDNQFKALSSNFGLKRPQSVPSSYNKPETISFTVESLRKCSHMYPEYLLKQLSNPQSQFYEVIDSMFLRLTAAENKQAIEFLQFMVQWKLYNHSAQFEQITIRKVYQMNLQMGEIFELLKILAKVDNQVVRDKITVDLENKLLGKIVDLQQEDYDALFKILNFMRIHDLHPKVSKSTYNAVMEEEEEAKEKEEKQDGQKKEKEEKGEKQAGKESVKDEKQKERKDEDAGEEGFFKVVQRVLIRNLQSMPISSLVDLIVHYGNNVKEDMVGKTEMLTQVEPKLLVNLTFLNHDQLIAAVYSYIRAGCLSDNLLEAFVKRVDLLFFQISWQNKRRILQLAASLPYNKWLFIVGLSIFEILKGKKVIHRSGITETDPTARDVEYQLLPAIYMAAYETDLLSAELVAKLQPRLLQNFFNLPAEDVGLVSWLFTITPPSMGGSRQSLCSKLQAIVVGGFSGGSYTLKDVAMVVWSLCNSGGKSNAIYNEKGDFWKNIELYIQERIAGEKEERLVNGCCHVLWAYLNSKSLSFKTVHQITDLIIRREEEGLLEEDMFAFELTTITSFYYSIGPALPPSIRSYIQTLSLRHFNLLLPQLDYLQIMKVLKFALQDMKGEVNASLLSQQDWARVLQQFELDTDRVEYGYLMGVVSFVLASPQGRGKEKRAIELVSKLMARKKKLQQLQRAQAVRQK